MSVENHNTGYSKISLTTNKISSPGKISFQQILLNIGYSNNYNDKSNVTNESIKRFGL